MDKQASGFGVFILLAYLGMLAVSWQNFVDGLLTFGIAKLGLDVVIEEGEVRVIKLSFEAWSTLICSLPAKGFTKQRC